MNILGIAPKGTFSGFENSFFDAIRNQGADVDVIHVEMLFFKTLCTLRSISFSKSKWGLRRDLAYNTSVDAYLKKSSYVQRYITNCSKSYDAIYQIGGLWNPVPEGSELPLILSLDYTSLLSEKRGSEWKRKPGTEREFWLREEKLLFDKANVICATTHNAKKSLVEDYGIDHNKVKVVGPGLSAPYDKLEPNRMPDYASKRILFVGKGYKGKGLDTLLSAFSIVKRHVPDAKLTVIGPAVEVQGDGVEYLGRISDKEKVKEWYYKSSVFAMPSIFEPVGQVFLEAMSCKLPCIGTTLDAMPEIIGDSVTGYTIEPGDQKVLATRLIDLLTESGLAIKMGKAGFEKLSREYTWDVVGEKILKSINSAIIQ